MAKTPKGANDCEVAKKLPVDVVATSSLLLFVITPALMLAGVFTVVYLLLDTIRRALATAGQRR
jgi:hypothetical protein